ncbi:PREDICTED: uncharacterized protein LOC109587756 [Amphimedon queenslandica]|uniref:Death domain-containing protein n=1 Tax=Amphimedon queenslandica TaxID=400682 RepID=A0AAN0JRR3_AMPQE|nr:PREDICTED: uncharacterized protein LOC109587756 [Amphimedon queenslandica]|eukprot:XP_019859537.1 PREDICTED: uncharacterized protein LOC109587756 [Amphimedon queenslandica]
MKLTLTRVLMIGPAGSGKTCAQHLLLNKPPLKQSTYSQTDSQTNTPSATISPPTDPDISSDSKAEIQSFGLTPHSIVFKPVNTDSTPIACKAIRALRIAFAGEETWKEITTDELREKLASSLKEAAENAAQQKQSESLLVVPFLKESEDKQEETPEEHDNPVSKETADCEAPRPGDEFKKIADLLPKAGAQLSEKWVYIVDSGGQPAYQELLPVFTRAATLNVITLDISKGIDEEFEFMYRINGQEFKCDEKMKYSNRKIFNSVVSSASVQKRIDIPFVKHQPKHSMSFVLGTHYDVLIERTNEKDAETKVVEMSDKLMSPTNILPHLECRIISKAYGNSVIHPVDTLQEDLVERTKNSRKILETMSKCTEVTMEIEVPMRCFVFELYLEEKTKNKGFVTKDEVIQSCKEDLYMSENNVEIALKFLHNSTIILYYPEIEPQLVFVNPQKILDVLSHLLALTYVDYPTAQLLATNVTESEMKRLKKAGLFEQVILDKFKKVFSDDFTPGYFINLLRHLHIISKLKSQDQVRDSYFLPSALPAYNNNYDITNVTTKPLYYVWLEQEDEWESKNAVLVPQGIFILFYVHLLEQREYKVEFTRHPKYRDALSLWIYIEGKRCTLYFINNRSNHIEIYFNGPKNYYCPQVRELITTTINKSSDAINVKRNHANAFPCPTEKEHCYCVVDEEYQVANCILCDSNDISEKDETYWCWFGLKPDSGLADIKKDSLLNTTHLHDVRMLLKEGGFSNAEWFDFGLGLGLYYDTLKTIKADYPRDTNGCVRECLVKWLEKADDVNEKGGAKWSTLIKALEDYNQSSTADYIRSKTLK